MQGFSPFQLLPCPIRGPSECYGKGSCPHRVLLKKAQIKRWSGPGSECGLKLVWPPYPSVCLRPTA